MSNCTHCAHCGWDIDTGKMINKPGIEFCPACGNGVGLHHEQPTLLDQFAMAALPECASEHRYKNDNGETVDKEAHMFADAMPKEREK